ncbi:MAG: hypothetical protein ACODAD_08505 [Planctomycetota bacterium]
MFMPVMPGHCELLILGFLFLVVVAPVVVLLAVIPFWQICNKAGLPPQLSLLMLVPVANLILPFYVSFTEWPALRQTPSKPPGKVPSG